eukprot:scaffold5580_cov61-Cyclotella_meneghiniana.AAC.8
MSSEWIDPRVSVFLIWGVCVTVFLCYPSKNFIIGVCHRLGFPCCPEVAEEQRTPAPSSDSVNEVDYEYLSDDKKQEIDSLRSIALLRYLSHFSMTINKNDMLHRQSLSKLHFNESVVSTSSDPQCREESNDLPDVETGSASPVSVMHNEEDECCNDVNGDHYTHVAIPCPGHGVGLSPITSPIKPEVEKQSKRRIFVRRKKDKAEPENHTSDNHARELSATQQGETEKRDVSLHCAICLMEYHVSERVCWASNPECTHVFHEDCIVNWLIHQGRIKSKMLRAESALTDAQLLNYKLECPCCRQDFIWKDAVAEIHESPV